MISRNSWPSFFRLSPPFCVPLSGFRKVPDPAIQDRWSNRVTELVKWGIGQTRLVGHSVCIYGYTSWSPSGNKIGQMFRKNRFFLLVSAQNLGFGQNFGHLVTKFQWSNTIWSRKLGGQDRLVTLRALTGHNPTRSQKFRSSVKKHFSKPR